MKQPALSSLRSGFTFIEILVTTAIIAILISIAVVSYGQITQNGRDSRRKQDLANVQAALEFYKLENGGYPTSCTSFCSPNGEVDWIPGLAPEFISTVPEDPREDHSGVDLESGAAATYNYESSGATSYQLRAWLETDGGTLYVVNSPN